MGDGHPDLAITNATDNAVAVRVGKGDGGSPGPGWGSACQSSSGHGSVSPWQRKGGQS